MGRVTSRFALPQQLVSFLVLSTIKRHKLSWFGHVRCHDTLPKFSPRETVAGTRRRWRLHKVLRGNIKEWRGQPLSSLLRIADDRSRWRPGIDSRGINLQQKPFISPLSINWKQVQTTSDDCSRTVQWPPVCCIRSRGRD